MKLKSLLIGSAAALVAATGARAADAIVIAEPEPMEYVRVCDMYGTGFFYIPGTETCLRIGGYIRVEGIADRNGRRAFVRFAPTFDARSDTEYGTLRSYARVYMQWERSVATASYGNTFIIDHALIELGDTFKATVGKGDTPETTLLGYGAYNPRDGAYTLTNQAYLALSYNGANGLQLAVAAVEDNDANWAPDVEVGARYNVPGTKSWIAAIGTYDESTEAWHAAAAAEVVLPNLPVRAKIMGFYSDAASSYRITDDGGVWAEWSVLGALGVKVHEKVEVAASAQWFSPGSWTFVGGLNITPVSGLEVRPEIVYASSRAVPNRNRWSGRIRFQRNF